MSRGLRQFSSPRGKKEIKRELKRKRKKIKEKKSPLPQANRKSRMKNTSASWHMKKLPGKEKKNAKSCYTRDKLKHARTNKSSTLTNSLLT